MMTTLGNKKNVKIFSFALAGVFIASVAAMAVVSMGDTANAAPTSDIGVVDQREVISANSTLAANYQQKMKETADEMQKDFDAKSEGMSDAEKEKLFTDMQQQFKGLALVVDKSAVIYGGTDITKEVTDSLSKSLSSAASSAASAASSESKK